MAEKKKSGTTSGGGVDLLDKSKSKKKLQPPSKYKVIYHNDDFTPMDIVTLSLINFFHHDAIKAISLMKAVHEKGKAVVGGPYSKEIAETKCKNVVQFFRALGFPLLSTIEKE